jgi:hypothetical protein
MVLSVLDCRKTCCKPVNRPSRRCVFASKIFADVNLCNDAGGLCDDIQRTVERQGPINSSNSYDQPKSSDFYRLGRFAVSCRLRAAFGNVSICCLGNRHFLGDRHRVEGLRHRRPRHPGFRQIHAVHRHVARRVDLVHGHLHLRHPVFRGAARRLGQRRDADRPQDDQPSSASNNLLT